MTELEIEYAANLKQHAEYLKKAEQHQDSMLGEARRQNEALERIADLLESLSGKIG